jgi:hypothetical protein
MTQSMMILIAGPYASGTNGDPTLMQQNLERLETAAWPLFRAGHIPMIGEWVALPVLRSAGATGPGDPLANAGDVPDRRATPAALRRRTPPPGRIARGGPGRRDRRSTRHPRLHEPRRGTGGLLSRNEPRAQSRPAGRARRWMRLPSLLKIDSISTGSFPVAVSQWGRRVSNSAASPGPSVTSCSPITRRRRPERM